MNLGFYLSPCGNHIIQIISSLEGYKGFVDIIGPCKLKNKRIVEDWICDLDKEDAKMIFGNWIYLGE